VADADVRARIAAAYADRRFWIVDGPARTNDGYRIVAGPLSATEVSLRPLSGFPRRRASAGRDSGQLVSELQHQALSVRGMRVDPAQAMREA
jgi:hypothetical protein